MNKPFGNQQPDLAAYVDRVYVPEDDRLREIRERSGRAGLPDIQLAALDARHLEVLVRAVAARRVVEIGTLGGYSGVALLRGMDAGGVLHTIEMEPTHAEVARESFRRAGFADRVHLHVGAAARVLPELVRAGPFDLCFIDADKEGYPDYLRWAAENLRVGGLVVLDNAFLFGHLPEPARGELALAIAAMQETHEILAKSGRFRATVLPTGEGLAVGVRTQVGKSGPTGGLPGDSR
jgi:caffeoyl-CoA O-methyltransferase